MNSTFASVFVEATHQAEAQADLGEGYFTAPLSADGAEPVTHYWSTGYWFDSDLDRIVNDVTWPRVVRFGDAQTALADVGLQQVQMVKPISEE